jgi:hypothetical protein
VERASRVNRHLLTPRNSRLPWLLVPALLTAAAAHLPVIRPHLQEAPYLGFSFIVLSVTLVVLASALVSWDAPVVYAGAAVTAGVALIGYTATRLVAFPMLADDVGNWLEPLGVVAVAAEVVAVCASVAALHAHVRSLNTATRSGSDTSDPEALPIAESAPAR